MGRMMLTLLLIGLFGGLLGCDRYEDEGFEEPVMEAQTPTEGTFVATVVGDKSISIAGAASFRHAALNRYRLSLDFETDTQAMEGNMATGLFLSTTWRRQAEAQLPSLGYANLSFSKAGTQRNTPTSWVVTGGSITLSLVTEDRIEGSFSVRAQGMASSQEGDQVTIVGSFIALPPLP